MPAHTFESLLRELGEKIQLPLESSSNNNLSLKLKDNEVVLQKDSKQPFLIISFEIAEIPIGRYRENLLREALKFNALNQLHAGVFAFSKKEQKLILFEMLPFSDISADQVFSIMQLLSEKVTVWKEALNRGNIPMIDPSSQARSGGGIFGIRP